VCRFARRLAIGTGWPRGLARRRPSVTTRDPQVDDTRAPPVILLTVFVTGFVNLYTHDIEAGLHFYRDLLGFTETFRTPAEGIPEHVELRLNEFMVGLGTVEAAKRVHGVEATPGSPAMVMVVWTDNVDKACADLAAAGVPVLQPPHDTGNSNRNALLRDPDGNLVEIVAKAS
jgi:lactoylglutathione lyase